MTTQRMKRCILCVAMALLAGFSASGFAATLHVWTNSPDDGPGTAWSNAFHTIQGGVDAATNAGDLVWVTNGIYDVGGGLTPGYTISNRVVIDKAITVESVNGPSNTLIVGQGPLGPDAMRCVYMTNGASLIGMTLTNGHTLSTGTTNMTMAGGGAYLHNGGTISNCIITDCEAQKRGGGVNGHYGGEILDSELKNNIVHRQGAAIRMEGGGRVERCHIHDNFADDWDGGGMYVMYEAVVIDCLIANNDGWSGGGIYAARSSNDGVRVYNCTIVENHVEYDGGGIMARQSGTFRNCIVWSNTAELIVNSGNYSNGGSGMSYEYTCTTPLLGGTGNTAADPQFADHGARDYQLSFSSPCVNAGGNSFVTGGAIDLIGRPRIIDGTVDMGPYEYPSPVVVITNPVTASVLISYDNTTYTVRGSNNEWVVGTMGWTNAFTGSNGVLAASAEWQVADIALDVGTNTITVSGTNLLGAVTNDSAQIIRGGAGTGAPVVDITNDNVSVSYDTTSYTLRGTNNMHVFGTMWVSNAANGEAYSFAAAAEWTAPSVTLVEGTNTIHVSGSNLWTVTGTDAGTVTRLAKQGGDSNIVYYVATNGAHIAPFITWEFAATNIQPAVDQARDGDGVRVSNGVYNASGAITPGYNLWNRVAVTNAVTVESINGPEATAIVGENNPAAVNLNDGGGSQYVRIEHAAELHPTNNYTLECWIYPRSFNFLGGFIGKYHSAAAGGYVLRLGQTTPYTSVDFDQMSTTNGVLQADRWYHLAAVNDNGTRRLYVDGVEKPVTGTAITIATNSDPVTFGVDYLASPRYFDGIMDEVRIWNVVRSEAEIQDAMNRRLSGTEAGLAGYWRMDEGSGTNAVDSTTNGNGGVLMNSASWMVTNTASVQMRCAYLANDAVLSGFTLTNGHTHFQGEINLEGGGGGSVLNGSGILSNCIVTGNSAWKQGGGINLNNGGQAWDCVVRGNHSDMNGGGVVTEGGTLCNALVYDNTAVNGGGVLLYNSGSVANCTMVSNDASNAGGGLYFYQGGTSVNCIAYGNTASSGDNYTIDVAGTLEYTCTTPDPGGIGNITNDPQFVGGADYRLTSDSPCINAGTNQAWMTSETDLQGYPRILNNIVDMGAYENPKPPVVDITNANASVYGGVTNYTIGGTNNTAVIDTMVWTNALNGSNGTLAATSPWTLADISLDYGDNGITVYGSNAYNMVANDSVTITRLHEHGPGSPIHYAATNGAAIYPYTNWTDAAATIQDAVDTASSNDTVLVSNGVYTAGGASTPGHSLSNRVCVTRSIRVEGVNGPSNTFIVGASDGGSNGPAAVRCVYLEDGASLAGFTLTNGHTWASGGSWQYDRSGGGLWLTNGTTASNCIISGCDAATAGGFFFFNGGTLSDSSVKGNITANEGGGGRCEGGGSVLRCLIEGNTAQSGGGGIYLKDGTPLIDRCEIRGNKCVASGADGGGIWLISRGTVRNCLITGNMATNGGGGLFFATAASNAVVENCTVVSNTAENGGGMRMWGGSVYNSIVYDNTGLVVNDNWSWGGNNPTIEYTCTTPTNSIPGGDGCITNDPLFTGGGNYRLAQGSSSIDAGDNATMPSGSDLDGVPRPLDGNNDDTNTVDMGCYEYINASADSDGDTMRDRWEVDHGLNPTNAADATPDSDGDGPSNKDEYTADTNPHNSNDYFHVVAISNNSPVSLHFESSSNRQYSLQGNGSLITGQWSAVEGATNQPGVGGADSIQDTNEPFKGPFYRLGVASPP